MSIDRTVLGLMPSSLEEIAKTGAWTGSPTWPIRRGVALGVLRDCEQVLLADLREEISLLAKANETLFVASCSAWRTLTLPNGTVSQLCEAQELMIRAQRYGLAILNRPSVASQLTEVHNAIEKSRGVMTPALACSTSGRSAVGRSGSDASDHPSAAGFVPVQQLP